MSRLRSLARRILGGRRRHLYRDVAAIKSMVVEIQHRVDRIDQIVLALNHDVRHGAGESLPLFLGYTERLRLDAETAVGVAQVIERRLLELEDRLDSIARS